MVAIHLLGFSFYFFNFFNQENKRTYFRILQAFFFLTKLDGQRMLCLKKINFHWLHTLKYESNQHFFGCKYNFTHKFFSQEREIHQLQLFP